MDFVIQDYLIIKFIGTLTSKTSNPDQNQRPQAMTNGEQARFQPRI